MTPEELLAAYDDQLREGAELRNATDVQQHGPVWWAEFDHGGFVTYRSLGGVAGDDLDRLIAETVTHYRDHTDVARAEWKTRGHDLPEDLGERLVAGGFVAEEVETVMIGEAASLAVDVPLPPGLSLRRIAAGPDARDDLERLIAFQDRIFGTPGQSVASALTELEAGTSEFWLAEAGSEVVCAGRLTPVPGTGFAGIWGGGTHPEWRGQGVYRALVAARARSAITRGVTHIHSDCTAMSRPILERSGLVAVTTTTPYVWTR